MVLGAIAILTMHARGVPGRHERELASAMADRDGVQAEYDARSAVNLSRLLIAMEPTIRQAIAPLFVFMKRTPPQLPVWEFSDQLLAPFNDKAANDEFAASMKLSFGTGKNLGLPAGKLRGEDRRRGREDQREPRRVERHRAHPPRQRAHGADVAAAVQPALRAARLDWQLSRPLDHLRRDHRLGRRRRERVELRHANSERTRERGRRGRVLPASRRSLIAARTRRTTRSKSSTWCAA